LECPVAIPERYGDRAAWIVGRTDVLPAGAVQIAHGDGGGAIAHAVGRPGAEGAVAVSQEHTDGIAGTDDGQVRGTVQVEVTDGDRVRLGCADGVIDRAEEAGHGAVLERLQLRARCRPPLPGAPPRPARPGAFHREKKPHGWYSVLGAVCDTIRWSLTSGAQTERRGGAGPVSRSAWRRALTGHFLSPNHGAPRHRAGERGCGLCASVVSPSSCRSLPARPATS